MSEAEVIDTANAEVVETPEVKEQPKLSRADWEARQIEKASKSGWKDFDEYVAEGGDPDKWKTADAFNTYGELIGTVKRQRQEFEQRLEGVQRLSEAQLAAQREQLIAKREEVMESGGANVVKDVKAIEKQIAALEQPVAQRLHPALEQWNAENEWINEDSPKSAYARQVYARETASGKSVEMAIAAVEAGLKKHYPPQTQKPVVLPEGERGTGPKGFGKPTKVATMDTLTDEERRIWSHSSHMWKNDQKAFLQSVNDLRKGAK